MPPQLAAEPSGFDGRMALVDVDARVGLIDPPAPNDVPFGGRDHHPYSSG